MATSARHGGTWFRELYRDDDDLWRWAADDSLVDLPELIRALPENAYLIEVDLISWYDDNWRGRIVTDDASGDMPEAVLNEVVDCFESELLKDAWEYGA